VAEAGFAEKAPRLFQQSNYKPIAVETMEGYGEQRRENMTLLKIYQKRI